MKRIAVVSDTHSPRFWKAMPNAVAQHLTDVDLILHAGDVCTSDVLDQLSEFAPVRVVQGNNDGDEIANLGATPTLELTVEGVCFAMIHDSGSSDGRLARMRRQFPNADCVIFGHSHIPMNIVDDSSSFRIFNPGSPTDKRRQPRRTMGLLSVSDGSISAEVIELD